MPAMLRGGEVAGALLLWGAFCACSAPALQAAAPAPAAGPEAEPRALLLRGGNLLTASGPALEGADLLIRGERIEAIGRNLALPRGAELIELGGRWLTPGLIDPHSHLGVYPMPMVAAHADGNEVSDPFTADVRALDSFWPQDPAIERARAGGVTAIHVLPGSANLVGGQGATLRLIDARSAREMEFPDAPHSMKLACGENPKRVYGEGRHVAPSSRMGEVALLRQRLEDARAWKPESGKGPDLELRALRQMLDGELLIQNHCYRADEMLLRLELFGEFDVRPRAFHHATEAYKIAGELAAAGVGAVVWADWWGIKLELWDAVPANAALLARAGVRVALHSDSPYDVQRLNQQAAVALAAGRRAGLELSRDEAIRWVTANPAWILGIDGEVGTLEPGKRADLAVWSADPFSVYARAELVLIDGRVVYERRAPREPRSDFELGLGGEP
jgi:imidazolonepropionase-like amidohydrolase